MEARTLNLFVWKDACGYLAVAHAGSVAEAREMLISEEHDCIGKSGDGSCPERDKAREHVRTANPFIYRGSHAEFALKDSAEVREQENYSSMLLKALEESLKLQSHYAGLLNQLDGGTRLQFSTSAAWLERLKLIAKADEVTNDR